MVRNKPNSLLGTWPTDVLNVLNVAADGGPCPNSSCPAGDVCNVRVTGEFYCQCVRDCVKRASMAQSVSDLWALFVIPFVFIIALLIVLIIVIYRRRRNAINKVRSKTNRIG